MDRGDGLLQLEDFRLEILTAIRRRRNRVPSKDGFDALAQQREFSGTSRRSSSPAKTISPHVAFGRWTVPA